MQSRILVVGLGIAAFFANEALADKETEDAAYVSCVQEINAEAEVRNLPPDRTGATLRFCAFQFLSPENLLSHNELHSRSK